MFKPTLITKLKLTCIATILAVTNLYALKASCELKPSPKELVDEVWQSLNHDYVDGSFNNQDWLKIRDEYLSRTYSSKEQAYGAIEEMVAKLDDRYTVFFDPIAYKDLSTELSGNLSGVGLQLAENEKTKAITVVTPIQDAPALKAGILANDVIVKVDGQPTQGMKLPDVVKKILGPVGTKVTLTIQRGSQTLDFNITRANINTNPVVYRTQTTAMGKIGYIRLPEFTETAPKQMSDAIQNLEKEQVQGYILDLRSDPGGLLNASIDIASMWLKEGTVVSLVNRDQVKESYKATGHPLTDKPLVVLVDNGSASASEILAGALQDDGRATLIGSRTFGKGVVQVVKPLDDGSALKMTVAKYYTPEGRDINHVGIAPDVTVDLTEEQQRKLVQNRAVATLEDPQYAQAVTHLTTLIQTAKN